MRRRRARHDQHIAYTLVVTPERYFAVGPHGAQTTPPRPACTASCSPGESASTLGLTGEETYSVADLAKAIPTRKVMVGARRNDGTVREFEATVRIDTPQEREYYRHGGILPYVLRQLLRA